MRGVALSGEGRVGGTNTLYTLVPVSASIRDSAASQVEAAASVSA